MTWDVQARRTHQHGSHVKVTWLEIGTVSDVSLDCPEHVHGASSTGLVRREMNTFSKAIDAYFQWDEGVESPCVLLSWSDAGEQCQQTLQLDVDTSHGLSRRPHLPARLHGRSGQHAAP